MQKCKAGAELDSREAIVDTLGELRSLLDPQLALLKPQIDKAKNLEALIASWYDNDPGEESFTVQGAKFSAIVAPRRLATEIVNRPRLRKILEGLKQFGKLWKVNLEDVRRLTTEEQQKTFLAETRSGSRKVEVVRKQ